MAEPCSQVGASWIKRWNFPACLKLQSKSEQNVKTLALFLTILKQDFSHVDKEKILADSVNVSVRYEAMFFYREKGARIKEGSMVPRDIRKHVFIGKKVLG